MAILLAHHSLGERDCRGCITALERGDGRFDLICSECGHPVQTDIHSTEVERELVRLAVTCGYLVFPCAHCGALNICTETAFSRFLVCPRCGVGMEAPVKTGTSEAQ